MQKKEYNSLPDSEKAKEDWVPYTYLIGWPDQNRWYYGVRYARSCKPEDLWNVYFTSSKIVKEFIKIHGDPIIKEVRKTFNNPDEARSWESRVLKKLHVVKKEEWLNKTDNRSITPLYGADNHSSKPEVKTKIANTLKKWHQNNLSNRYGTVTPDDVKEKQSKAKQGELNPFFKKKHTEKNIELFSKNQRGSNNSFHGKKHSLETKEYLSMISSGIPKPTTQCPHCGKIGGINTMPRWHFNNCKELKNVI